MLRVIAVVILALTGSTGVAQDEVWHHLALSPSGDRVAYAQVSDGQSAIYLLDLESGATRGAMIGDMQVEALYWASSTDLISAMSGSYRLQTIDFNTESIDQHASAVYRIDTLAMEAIPLLSGDNRLDTNLDLSRLSGINHGRREVMIPALAYSSGFGFLHTQNDILLHLKPTNLDVPRVHLFAIDLERGRGRLREAGANDTIFWTVDHDGNAAWRIDWQERNGDLRFVRPNGRGSGRVSDVAALPQILGMTPSGSVAFLVETESDRTQLFTAHPERDGPARLISPIDIDQPGEILSDHASNTIVGFRFDDGSQQTAWLDSSLAETDMALSSAFPNRVTKILCWSEDRGLILFAVDDDLFIFEAATQQARLIQRDVV
jgi:hypothetical protein